MTVNATLSGSQQAVAGEETTREADGFIIPGLCGFPGDYGWPIPIMQNRIQV